MFGVGINNGRLGGYAGHQMTQLQGYIAEVNFIDGTVVAPNVLMRQKRVFGFQRNLMQTKVVVTEQNDICR